jgi:hypothetical protein
MSTLHTHRRFLTPAEPRTHSICRRGMPERNLKRGRSSGSPRIPRRWSNQPRLLPALPNVANDALVLLSGDNRARVRGVESGADGDMPQPLGHGLDHLIVDLPLHRWTMRTPVEPNPTPASDAPSITAPRLPRSRRSPRRAAVSRRRDPIDGPAPKTSALAPLRRSRFGSFPGQRLTATYFVSRYSSMPSWPPSRPKPDCFTPPKGAEAFETMPWFRPTMPVSSPSTTLRARLRSRV